jgi:alpha-tubulin suppressor-like RCC1 family protein
MSKMAGGGAGGFFFGITPAEELWVWGSSTIGAMGIGFNGGFATTTPTQVALASVTDASVGNNFSVILAASGVYASGSDANDQLGRGDKLSGGEPQFKPVIVEGVSEVTKVAAGGWSGYALKNDGSVWAWGYDGEGQLGNNKSTKTEYFPKPASISGLSNIIAIAAGSETGYALNTEGIVWAWGANKTRAAR